MSATPILDLDRPLPQRPKRWLPPLIGLGIGGVIGLLFVLADQYRAPGWRWPEFNGLLFIPALYAAIALHEIGHLAAGSLAGLDPGGMSIGAFVFTKSGDHWVFQFDRRRWLGGYFKPLTGAAGVAASRYAWMVAGGPLASVLFALLCGLLWVQYGDGRWAWIASLYWTALFTFILSTLPYSVGLNKSDGARLWQLLRRPQHARTCITLLAVQTEEAYGSCPREWNSEHFAELLAVDVSAGEYLYCQLLAYYRRLDEGLEAAALVHLENALARSGRVERQMRHALFLEAACSSALARKHAGNARIWSDRAWKLRKPEWPDVVDGAIAMCEERYEEAARHWEAANARVVRLGLDSGLIRFAKEKWAEYQADCLAACSGVC